MNKNPLHITYNGLIKLIDSRLIWMETNYPRMVNEGKMSAWKSNNHIAYYRQLVKMLKSHKKDPQLNLNDVFDHLVQ